MKTIKLKSGTELPLMNLKGKDYLQAAYRLVWLREEHPDWGIETELLSQSDQSAVAKATIKDATGRIIATAHKEESAKDFPMGHREKAETGAIARALGLCGYGTQYEPDFDEGKRVVDSPVGHNPIFMEQPGEGDGTPDDTYRIPFGKFKQRTLEQVGVKELQSYVNYLEDKAHADGKKIEGQVGDFIQRAVEYVIAFETSPLEDFNNFDPSKK
jgi:hypothetical protein